MYKQELNICLHTVMINLKTTGATIKHSITLSLAHKTFNLTTILYDLRNFI